FHRDAGDALGRHADHAGCRSRQIDDAASHIGSTVVDLDLDRAAVAHMRDAHPRAEGQRLVRGRHGVGIEPSAGSQGLRLPVERGHAPRAGTLLVVGVEALLAPGRRRLRWDGRRGDGALSRLLARMDDLVPDDARFTGSPLMTPRVLGDASMAPFGVAVPGSAIVSVVAAPRPDFVVIVGFAVAGPGKTWALQWVRGPEPRSLSQANLGVGRRRQREARSQQ